MQTVGLDGCCGEEDRAEELHLGGPLCVLRTPGENQGECSLAVLYVRLHTIVVWMFTCLHQAIYRVG